MKIYHSYWEWQPNIPPHLYQPRLQSLHRLHELSCLTSLKSYGNCHLITTKGGKEFLGDLPYTSIELFEDHWGIDMDNFPKEWNHLFTVGKLLGFLQIINKGEPFLHIDYDVFLFKKFPQEILNKPIILQGWESPHQLRDYYGLDDFTINCPNKYIFDSSINWAFNTGIIGGWNLEFLKYFVEENLKLLTDKDNQNFWSKPKSGFDGRYLILEQYWMAQCLKQKQLEPYLILPHKSHKYLDDYAEMIGEDLNRLGFTHLMGNKKWDEATYNLLGELIEVYKNNQGRDFEIQFT